MIAPGVVSAALAVGAAAGAAAVSLRADARRRLDGALCPEAGKTPAYGGDHDRRTAAGRGAASGTRRRSLELTAPAVRRGFAALAGGAVAVLLGGLVGVVAGLAAALVLDRVMARLPDPRDAARTARLALDLPLALDVVAACLAVGAPLPAALESAGTHLGGPLAAVLGEVVGQLRLGADVATAWGAAAREPVLSPLVETVARAGDSGAALGPALRRLASDERDRLRAAHEASARRIGVFVVVPLGTCFLPAFLLIGVVPVVAGLVGRLLP